MTILDYSFTVPSSLTRGRRRNRYLFPVASPLVLLPGPLPFYLIFPALFPVSCFTQVSAKVLVQDINSATAITATRASLATVATFAGAK